MGILKTAEERAQGHARTAMEYVEGRRKDVNHSSTIHHAKKALRAARRVDPEIKAAVHKTVQKIHDAVKSSVVSARAAIKDSDPDSRPAHRRLDDIMKGLRKIDVGSKNR